MVFDSYVFPDDIDNLEKLDAWFHQFSFLNDKEKETLDSIYMDTFGECAVPRYYNRRNELLREARLEQDQNSDTIDSEDIQNDIDEAIHPLLDCTKEEWADRLLRARNMEASDMIIMIDTESDDPVSEYTLENLDRLEKKWRSLMLIDSNHRMLSNQTAKSIFGLENNNLYNIIKTYVTNKYDEGSVIPDILNNYELRRTIKVEVESADSLRLLIRSMVDQDGQYNTIIQSPEIRNISPNPLPFFTPDEMEQYGVFSGEINMYSKKPDNDLIDNRSILEWFKEYKTYDGKILPSPYQWEQTLKRLYSDYKVILNSGDINKIASRKQSILELGWNPEIDFTPEALRRVSKAHNIVSNVENTSRFTYVDLSDFVHTYRDKYDYNGNKDYSFYSRELVPIAILIYRGALKTVTGYDIICKDDTALLTKAYKDSIGDEDLVYVSLNIFFVTNSQYLNMIGYYEENLEISVPIPVDAADKSRMNDKEQCEMAIYELMNHVFGNEFHIADKDNNIYCLYRGTEDTFKQLAGNRQIFCEMIEDFAYQEDKPIRETSIADLNNCFTSFSSLLEVKSVINHLRKNSKDLDSRNQDRLKNMLTVDSSVYSDEKKKPRVRNLKAELIKKL